MKSADRAHQVVVHPQATHGVMRRWVDSHWHLAGILGRDLLIHVKKVAVSLLEGVLAQPLDRIRKTQVHPPARRSDAASFVTDLLGATGGNIAGREVAETWVLSFQIVVAFLLGDLIRGTLVAFLFGYPYSPIVPQRLGHQCQFRLVLASMRYAGRVNLCKARVGESGSAQIRAVTGGDIAALGIGRQIEGIAVTSRGQDHGMCSPRSYFPAYQITSHDPSSPAIHDHEVHLFRTDVHVDSTPTDLPI